MNVSPLLLIALLSTFILGVIHHLAIQFFLYWQLPWFDIPMHILGGVTLALFLIALSRLFSCFTDLSSKVLPVVLGVLILGGVWEVFEIWAGIPLYEEGFYLDLVKDLIMDSIGAMIGFTVGTSIIELEDVDA